jgi:hypothetical protein
MKNHIMLEIKKWSISTINCHGFSENLTNPSNLTTHLIISSLKKIYGKKIKPLNPTISLAKFFFPHLITCTFAIRIYSHKSGCKDATWCPMAYESPFKLQKLHFLCILGCY